MKMEENKIKFINPKINKLKILGLFIKKTWLKTKNKLIIWKDTERCKGYKEIIIDVIQYGLIFNSAITILSKGWFPFNIFTFIGWGCFAHIIYEYPKYWVEEVLKRK